MALFNKRSNEHDEAAGRKVAAGMSLMRLNLVPIIIAVVVVLAAGCVSYLQFSLEVAGSQHERHEANAERMASYLTGRIDALSEQVSMMAVPDEALLTAIETSDFETLRYREALFAARFPEAQRLRFILPAEVEPDNSVFPPLGYACLDLVRQSEGGKQPPIELHLFGSEEAHIDIVKPVRNEAGKVVASLMVTLSPTALKKWLVALKPAEVYAELQQGESGLKLGSVGNGTVKKGEPLTRVAVEGSSWQLAYWMGDDIGIAEVQKFGFLATFIVAAALLALLLFFFGLMRSRRVNHELTAMVNFIVESSRGKRFHSYPVKLVEIEHALRALEPVLVKTPGKEASTDKARKREEEVPDLLFADFGEITVEEEGAENSSGDEVGQEKS